MSAAPLPVLVTGLRRSGTTALWRALAHGAAFAFDEPFHPRLWDGARQNPKGTWTNLDALWREGPGDLVPGVRPIAPLEELSPAVDPAQAAYLATLLRRPGPVVVDVVRCWNKMAALAPALPPVLVVQLVRSPVAFALSHLLPSGAGSWRKPVGDALRRASALWRRGWYDNWQMETIVNAALAAGHPVWDEAAMPADALAAAPAHVKLLAFWWGANRIMARALATALPGAHAILLAEDFMARPPRVAAALAAAGGRAVDPAGLAHVRPARAHPLAAAPAFARAFETLGIPAALLPAAAPDTAAVARALGGRPLALSRPAGTAA